MLIDVSPWEIDIASMSSLHVIVNANGANIRIPIAVHELINNCGHGSWRLVSYHLPEDGEAHRTPDPILFTFETIKA